MASSIRNAIGAGFAKDEVARGKSYPAEEVEAALGAPDLTPEVEVSEAQAKESFQNSVDSTNARRKGAGPGSVYAYGYRCAADRMKVGYTDGDTIERIAAQITTSTPDKPVLFFEMRTDRSRALERALHAILVYRGKKVAGGGDEWFLTTVDDVERPTALQTSRIASFRPIIESTDASAAIRALSRPYFVAAKNLTTVQQ